MTQPEIPNPAKIPGRPAEPLDAGDAAQALVDLGLARDYEQARGDLEEARAEVAAERAAAGAEPLVPTGIGGSR